MQRKLLTSKEAAQYLGISLSFLRKMMMNRIIPMYKPNGKLCYFGSSRIFGAFVKTGRLKC